MTERDGLDARLKDLEQAAHWVDDPLDPAEIRRRGQRRHRRRWAATGALGAVLLLAGAAGVFGAAVGPQQREPDPAGVPTVSTSPTPTETATSLEPGRAGSAEGTLVPRRTRTVPGYPTDAPSSATPGEGRPTTEAPSSETPSASPTGEDSPTSDPEPSETTEPEPTSQPGDDGGQPTVPAPQPTGDGDGG